MLFNKTNSIKFLNLIYCNSNVYLDRKFLKYNYFANNNFAVYVSDYIDYNRAISEKAKSLLYEYINKDMLTPR
jgi:hypothetical protein